MLHDLVLDVLARPLADDPPSITTAISTLVATVFGGIAAVLTAVAAVVVALRKLRAGGSPDLEDDDDDDDDQAPPRPVGRTQRVETGWVGWAQRRIARLEGDLLAAQQTSASMLRQAEKMDDENERLKEWKATALAAESARRERFLRAGVDPDTAMPLPSPLPTSSSSPTSP